MSNHTVCGLLRRLEGETELIISKSRNSSTLICSRHMLRGSLDIQLAYKLIPYESLLPYHLVPTHANFNFAKHYRSHGHATIELGTGLKSSMKWYPAHPTYEPLACCRVFLNDDSVNSELKSYL